MDIVKETWIDAQAIPAVVFNPANDTAPLSAEPAPASDAWHRVSALLRDAEMTAEEISAAIAAETADS